MSADSTGPRMLTYASWPTPLTSRRLVEASSKFGELALGSDAALSWSASRPSEGGRVGLVRCSFGFDLPLEEGISPIEIRRAADREA